MKGVVLGYDTEAEAVVVRAEDGRRYQFPLTEWRDRQGPRKGDEVDFEFDGVRAADVYAVSPSRPLDAAAVAPLSIISAWAPARFFVARPVLTCALLVLLACFAGAYAIGDVRISVLQAPELISRMAEALDSLIAASGADPAPRLGAGVARILLVLLLGLYAVPVLAGVTIWREVVGRPDRTLARYAGIAAVVLPIGLPLIVALLVQTWVISGITDVSARLGRSGVTTPQQVFEVLRLYATGTVLLVFAGAALWAAASGRLSLLIVGRAAPRTQSEPIKPRARSRPDLFAPLRSRRAAARKSGRGSASKSVAAKSTSKPAPTEPQVAASGPAGGTVSARRGGPPESERPPLQPAAPAAGRSSYADDLEAALGEAKAAEPPSFLQVGEAAVETAAPTDAPRHPPVSGDDQDGVGLPPRSGSVWPRPTAGLPRTDAGDDTPPSATDKSGKSEA